MTMTSAFFQNFLGATNAVKGARSLGIPGKQGGDSFLSMVRRVVQFESQPQGTPATDMQSSNKSSATRPQPLRVTSFQSRINDLRESFLSRGTPLDQVVLSDSDLADLRSILEELGFPGEHMDAFFQGMMEDRRGTDIALSDFFQDFSQYAADVEAADTALSSGMNKNINSAAIPHFESVLRDLGVSVEAVNAMFSSAMDQEGNLDMERLIPQLKKIDISRDVSAGDTSVGNAAQAVSGEGTQPVLTRRIENGLKRMGVELPGYKAGEAFNLGDLIGVMESHAGVTRTAGIPSSGNMDAEANDVVSGISVDQAGDNEDVAMFFGHAREMMLRDSFDEQYFDTPVKNNNGTSGWNTRGTTNTVIPSSSTSSASPEAIGLSSAALTDAKPVSSSPQTPASSPAVATATIKTIPVDSPKKTDPVSVIFSDATEASPVVSLETNTALSSSITSSEAVMLSSANSVKTTMASFSAAESTTTSSSTGAAAAEPKRTAATAAVAAATKSSLKPTSPPTAMSVEGTSASIINDLESVSVAASKTKSAFEMNPASAKSSVSEISPGMDANKISDKDDQIGHNGESIEISKTGGKASTISAGGDDLRFQNVPNQTRMDTRDSRGITVDSHEFANHSRVFRRAMQAAPGETQSTVTDARGTTNAAMSPSSVSAASANENAASSAAESSTSTTAAATAGATKSSLKPTSPPTAMSVEGTPASIINDLESVSVAASKTKSAFEMNPASATLSASVKPTVSATSPGMDANKISRGDDQVGHNGESIESSKTDGKASTISAGGDDLRFQNVPNQARMEIRNSRGIAVDSHEFANHSRVIRSAMQAAPGETQGTTTDARGTTNVATVLTSKTKTAAEMNPASTRVSASAKPSASEIPTGMDANKMSGGDDRGSHNDEPIEISKTGGKASTVSAGGDLRFRNVPNQGRMDTRDSRGIQVEPYGPAGQSQEGAGTAQSASSVTPGAAVDPLISDRTSGTETARVLDTWGFGVAAPDRFMIKRDASSQGRGFRNNGRSVTASTGNPDSSTASSGTAFEVNTTVTAGHSDFSKSVHALIDGIVSGAGSPNNGHKGKESWSDASRESLTGMDRSHGFGQTSASGFNNTVHENPVAKGGEFQPRFPEHAVTQAGKEIASFLQRGDRVLKLQLRPVELGTVNIEMDVKENVMKLSIVAETSAAKEMFIANHNELRRVLEGYGVKLEALDVQMDNSSSFEQSLADGNESSFHEEQKNQRWGRRTLGDATAVADELTDIRPMSLNPDALLDLLV